MSKINQIQERIIEIDGGAFQKLADSSLAKLDYSPIIPIGSVIGSNKTGKAPLIHLCCKEAKNISLPNTQLSKMECWRLYPDVEPHLMENR